MRDKDACGAGTRRATTCSLLRRIFLFIIVLTVSSLPTSPAVTLFPHFPSSLLPFLLRIFLSTTTSSSPSPLPPSSSLAVPAASFLPLPSQRGRGRNILDVPRGIEGGYLHTNDNWWVSVSRFGREVSPGPPTRRSETTTTTTRRPLAVTHPTVFWCAYLFGLPANRPAKRSFSRRRASKRSRPVSPEDTRATSPNAFTSHRIPFK